MTTWTVAHQARVSMGILQASLLEWVATSFSRGSWFTRQEYWSGLPFPSPGDLPNPEIKPGSPALQGDSLPSEPSGTPWRSGQSFTLSYRKAGLHLSEQFYCSKPKGFWCLSATVTRVTVYKLISSLAAGLWGIWVSKERGSHKGVAQESQWADVRRSI